VTPTNDLPQRSTAGAPPAPSRTRMVRPGFYRSSLTGSLPPDCRDLLIGLTTCADDEGWLLWQPSELAAWIYPYAPAAKRLRDLERRAQRLVDAGLVVIKACGCAFLPTLQEHHAVKAGNKTTAVWGWHERHKSLLVSTDTDLSRSESGSESSSGSVSESGSGSSRERARDGQGATRAADREYPPSGALDYALGCFECGWVDGHSSLCANAPHLRAVR
jgi:hypothetical protein